MRNFKREYNEVAYRDPATALMTLMIMAGVSLIALIVGGVLFGSYAFLWWVWPIKAGVLLLGLGINWVIWTVVAKTFGAC